MELFRGRCLLCGAFFFVVTAVCAWFYPEFLTFAILFLVLLISMPLLAYCAQKQKISGYRLFSVITVIIFCALFILRSGYMYLSVWEKALELTGDGRQLIASVCESGSYTSYSSTFTVQLDSVDGEKVNTKAVLYCQYLASFRPGDVLNIENAEISPSRDTWYGYASDGCVLYITSEYESSVTVCGYDERCTEGAAIGLKKLLSYRLSDEIGGKAGILCSAMLLGDGDSVDACLRVNFRRAGISHLLAVSGMHLSVIAAILSFVFKKVRLPVPVRIALLSAVMTAYLWILGFPISAVRSVAMLFISYAGIIFGISTDGLSSLSLALMLVLMISPEAVADSAFILSFCATFGIIAFSPMFAYTAEKMLYRDKKKRMRSQKVPRIVRILERLKIEILFRILPSVMAVFSVSIMTAIPLACLYGEVSLFTPVSNLIFPVLAIPVLLFSLLTLCFLGTPFVFLFSSAAKKSADLIISLSEKISDIRGVALSLKYPFVFAVLIPALILTFVLLSVKLKHRAFVYLPVLAGFLCLCLLYVTAVPDGAELFFCGSGSNEAAAIVSKGSSVIIDLGSGSYNTIYEITELASQKCSTEIEALILTHYHLGHSAAVYKLGAKNRLFSVWLPKPSNADDAANALRIIEAARLVGAVCYMYENAEMLKIYGDIGLSLSGISRIERSSHPVLCFGISSENGKILYIGRSVWEAYGADLKQNTEFSEIQSLIDADTHVICGNHGPVLRSECRFVFENAGTVHLFSDENCRYWFGMNENRPSGLACGLYMHSGYARFTLR